MTHDEINRAISSWFEPMPINDRQEFQQIYSPKGYWRWGGSQWFPVYKFFTSEEANVRLRKAIRARFPYVSVTYERFINGDEGIEFEFSGAEGEFAITFHEHDELKAWVLAFLKFAGIEAEL